MVAALAGGAVAGAVPAAPHLDLAASPGGASTDDIYLPYPYAEPEPEPEPEPQESGLGDWPGW